MIDMRYKPKFLPQVEAPYEVVMEKLGEEGVDCGVEELNPQDLEPMQGIVFGDEVGGFNPDEMNPIFISKDNDIVDGHHRFVRALNAEQPIKCVRVGLNGKDTARVLNKIQDIYEYEQQTGMENMGEVVVQNTINDENESQPEKSFDDFIGEIESIEPTKGDGCKVVAYRQNPIMENSAIGNFFLLTPQQGYSKYEIDFENLLDTNELGLDLTGRNPVDTLAKNWFPNVDFESASKPYKYTPEQMKNKAISEKAKKMGYDGIKYGDIMIQGLK